MPWTANCKVTAVDGAKVTLSATGADITSTGDDHADEVEATVTTGEGQHPLAVGDTVTITATC